MVKSMHRRASNLPFEKDQPGCMWSVFQLFRSHQHVNGRKPPSEWGQDGEGRTAAGSKHSKSKKHIRPNLYADTNTLVEKQDNSLRKIHGYTSPGPHCATKPPRLTRTMSIHHLKCNDYIDDVSVDGKSPSSENESAHDLRTLENSEEGYKNEPHRILGPLDAKMESFFEVIKDPDHLSVKHLQDVKSSAATSVLARSGSYPGTRCLRSSQNTENCSEVQISSYHLKIQKDHASSISHAKDVKERLKDMTKENMVTQFISMDGIMDKVPYGHKISHDLGDQTSTFNRHRWRSKSVRESAALAEKRHVIPHFSRSRSLSDSLDRFSTFLLSNSDTKLEPMHEDGPSITKRNLSLRVNGTTHSLPEFLFDFPTKESPSMLLHSASSKKARASDLNEPFPEVESSKETYDTRNQVVCEDHDIFPSHDPRTHPSYCDDIKTEAVFTSEPGKLSPQSVLDREFEEDAINPFSVVGGQSDHDIHQVVQEPAHAASADRITSELNEVQAQVDSKDEADFSYIVNVLIRTGFYGSGKQNTPELPLSPMVFKELEGLSPETEICTLDADIDLNHLLLFDLVDEVLSEIYDNSTALSLRPSLYNSWIKSVPTGLQCLKEVWSEVGRHLNGQSPSLNHHISQDLKKEDGCMKHKLECEDVGIEVEERILDDLLDELILGWPGLCGNN